VVYTVVLVFAGRDICAKTSAAMMFVYCGYAGI
jgi:hypothetical protein